MMSAAALLQDVAPIDIVWPIRKFFAGLDVGQSIDPSALAVIERASWPADGDLTSIRPGYRKLRHQLAVRHLERLPLRTDYSAQALHVRRLLDTAPLRGATQLVLDSTGVGRPVAELFRAAGLAPIEITITAGDSWTNQGSVWRVSKLLLVSRVQAALHARTLKIAKGIPDGETLVRELQDFRVGASDTGQATFGARSGRHDDLVLALAVALFVATEVTRSGGTSREFLI